MILREEEKTKNFCKTFFAHPKQMERNEIGLLSVWQTINDDQSCQNSGIPKEPCNFLFSILVIPYINFFNRVCLLGVTGVRVCGMLFEKSRCDVMIIYVKKWQVFGRLRNCSPSTCVSWLAHKYSRFSHQSLRGSRSLAFSRELVRDY